MKAKHVPRPDQIHQADIIGTPGNYMVKINGEPLQNKEGLCRRFVTSDAAVKNLARHGVNEIKVCLATSPAHFN